MARDIKCGACGKALTSFETITVAGEGDRCYSCFTARGCEPGETEQAVDSTDA